MYLVTTCAEHKDSLIVDGTEKLYEFKFGRNKMTNKICH